MINKQTPKREITKRVNLQGYTNKRTGKRVGPYKKTFKKYPNHYFTELIDPNTGQKRLAEVWVKGTQRRYRWIDDKRKAQLIALSKAEQHFKSLPKKRQESDLRKTSKNQLEIIEKDGEKYVKESYITESGPSRYDIKGVDTKIDEWVKDWDKAGKIKTKYKKTESFYNDFYTFEARQNRRNELEGRIKFLEQDLKYTPHKEKVKTEIEQCKKELENLGVEKWQEKPSRYYYEEIDPRYKRLKDEAKGTTFRLQRELNDIKEKFEKQNLTADEKYRLAIELDDKNKEMEKQREINKKLFEETKYIYWNDNLIEATLKVEKEIPSKVIEKMPDEYKEQYNKTQEKKVTEKKKRSEDIEKQLAEAKSKVIEREQANENARKQLPEMQDLFKQNAKGKANKLEWEEAEIIEFGAENEMIGIMDPSKITLLTTNEQFKGTKFGEQFKDHKKIEFENKPIIMDQSGFQYDFDEKGGGYYSQEYIDLALKSMNDPQIYYKKNTPLIIKDDTYTYVIAPRIEEADEDDWDEDDKPTEKEIYDPRIKITPKEYKALMNASSKAELIKQCEALESKYESKKKDKHEVLYDLLQRKQQQVHEKEIKEKLEAGEKIYGMTKKDIEDVIKTGGHLDSRIKTQLPEEQVKQYENTKRLREIQENYIEKSEKKLNQLKKNLTLADPKEIEVAYQKLKEEHGEETAYLWEARYRRQHNKERIEKEIQDEKTFLENAYKDLGGITTENYSHQLKESNITKYKIRGKEKYVAKAECR